jgi:fatty-acyl-CoA synthase
VVQLRQGLTATEEEIVEHCRNSLSGYKKPRRVVFVDNIPVSPAGKIQKFKLKEEYGK